MLITTAVDSFIFIYIYIFLICQILFFRKKKKNRMLFAPVVLSTLRVNDIPASSFWLYSCVHHLQLNKLRWPLDDESTSTMSRLSTFSWSCIVCDNSGNFLHLRFSIICLKYSDIYSRANCVNPWKMFISLKTKQNKQNKKTFHRHCVSSFMLSTLGRIYSRQHIEIFSSFSQKTGFDSSCKLSPPGDNLHEMSEFVFWEK